jgi:hypothetical protein
LVDSVLVSSCDVRRTVFGLILLHLSTICVVLFYFLLEELCCRSLYSLHANEA